MMGKWLRNRLLKAGVVSGSPPGLAGSGASGTRLTDPDPAFQLHGMPEGSVEGEVEGKQ